MTTNRMEAFSDGVLAIIITIMVLELKVPNGTDFQSLRPTIPVFLGYVLSFLYVGIYWTNHHHLINALASVNGKILWANLHLLFWLSLIPVATAWAGKAPLSKDPTCVYGIVLLMCSIAYMVLQRQVVQRSGKDSALAKSLGKDWKGKVSTAAYAAAVAIAFWLPVISYILFIAVALLWIIPDIRIEHALTD